MLQSVDIDKYVRNILSKNFSPTWTGANMDVIQNADANTLVVALALSEDRTMNSEHFGAANLYAIYRCSNTDYEHIIDVQNVSVEERFESDPLKVKSVKELLAPHSVSVVVSPRFGPNIRKMRMRLTPVVVRTRSREITIKWLMRNWSAILESSLQEGVRDTIVIDDCDVDKLSEAERFAPSTIDYDLCRNCGKCVKMSDCPSGAIAFSQDEDAIVQINGDICVGCGLCADVCPFGAISVTG